MKKVFTHLELGFTSHLRQLLTDEFRSGASAGVITEEEFNIRIILLQQSRQTLAQKISAEKDDADADLGLQLGDFNSSKELLAQG